MAFLILSLTAPAFAQSKPSVPVLEEAALPRYPAIAKAAHITGRVVVRVSVQNGLVDKADVLSSNSKWLDGATVSNLKTWHFAADIKAQFTITYSYQISGPESETRTNEQIEMLPSLDVNITARPIKPTVNYGVQGSSPR